MYLLIGCVYRRNIMIAFGYYHRPVYKINDKMFIYRLLCLFF